MPLPLLNEQGPTQTEAKGMLPPIIRAVTHLGFAVQLVDTILDDDWAETRDTIVSEIDEAHLHLNWDLESDHSPFIPEEALTRNTVLKEQFVTLRNAITSHTREEAFSDLKTLIENCAFNAATLERFITGNDADEGRNP